MGGAPPRCSTGVLRTVSGTLAIQKKDGPTTSTGWQEPFSKEAAEENEGLLQKTAANGKPWRRIGWPEWPKLRAAEERKGDKGAGRTGEGQLTVGRVEPRGAAQQRRTYEDLFGVTILHQALQAKYEANTIGPGLLHGADGRKPSQHHSLRGSTQRGSSLFSILRSFRV